MNCYDCATIGHQNSAVAACIDCGAGVVSSTSSWSRTI